MRVVRLCWWAYSIGEWETLKNIGSQSCVPPYKLGKLMIVFCRAYGKTLISMGLILWFSAIMFKELWLLIGMRFVLLAIECFQFQKGFGFACSLLGIREDVW